MRLLTLITCLFLVAGPVFGADVRSIRAECPLCGSQFKYRLVLQELTSGFRLDFKQFGNVDSPAQLADCPKCKFVLPDGGRDELSREEISVLRELVKSDRYRAAVDETSYFRLAIAFESLGRPPDEIAFAYVAASWQVDDEPIRCQVYLARALSWYDVYLARPEPITPRHVRAMLLKVEILRRLGRFAEAREFVSGIVFHPAMACQTHQNILQQQRDLVDAQDDQPHLAIADDARVEVSMRVVTPGARSLRPAFGLQSRMPAFPAGPYAARVGGVVTLLVNVTRSGYVVNWTVQSSTAEAFSNAVSRSVRDWTFDPAPLDGAPSPVQLECIVYFALES